LKGFFDVFDDLGFGGFEFFTWEIKKLTDYSVYKKE
jgi:hypothetical protein